VTEGTVHFIEYLLYYFFLGPGTKGQQDEKRNRTSTADQWPIGSTMPQFLLRLLYLWYIVLKIGLI
jgi:hypothetical protein